MSVAVRCACATCHRKASCRGGTREGDSRSIHMREARHRRWPICSVHAVGDGRYVPSMPLAMANVFHRDTKARPPVGSEQQRCLGIEPPPRPIRRQQQRGSCVYICASTFDRPKKSNSTSIHMPWACRRRCRDFEGSQHDLHEDGRGRNRYACHRALAAALQHHSLRRVRLRIQAYKVSWRRSIGHSLNLVGPRFGTTPRTRPCLGRIDGPSSVGRPVGIRRAQVLAGN